MLCPLGTIFESLATMFDAPFPRFGQSLDFGMILAPLDIPFSLLGITFSLCWASEADVLFRQPGVTSHVAAISVEIL